MRTIKQMHHISASPNEVYTALTNPFTIELWSGFPAIMSTIPETEFLLFDGDITGRNIEFIDNKLIRQLWYFEGDSENSVVTFILKSDKNSTIIELCHTNVPEKVYDEMADGWKNIYFRNLKEFFK